MRADKEGVLSPQGDVFSTEPTPALHLFLVVTLTSWISQRQNGLVCLSNKPKYNRRGGSPPGGTLLLSSRV